MRIAWGIRAWVYAGSEENRESNQSVDSRQVLTARIGFRSAKKGWMMLDIIFIAATALFFAIGIFYVRGCERLK
jgi:hypothetical protein